MSTLINTTDIWDRMTPAQQRAFGNAGIIHLLGIVGGSTAANFEGWDLMSCTLDEVAPELRTVPHPRPDLTALGLRTCRVCGCTDTYGKEEYCWPEDDLCSSCLEPVGVDGRVMGAAKSRATWLGGSDGLKGANHASPL
jgi:hypothetical protein